MRGGQRAHKVAELAGGDSATIYDTAFAPASDEEEKVDDAGDDAGDAEVDGDGDADADADDDDADDDADDDDDGDAAADADDDGDDVAPPPNPELLNPVTLNP